MVIYVCQAGQSSNAVLTGAAELFRLVPYRENFANLRLIAGGDKKIMDDSFNKTGALEVGK